MKLNIQNKFYIELKKIFGNKTSVFKDEDDGTTLIVQVPFNKMSSTEIHQRIEQIAEIVGINSMYEFSNKMCSTSTYTEEFVVK